MAVNIKPFHINPQFIHSFPQLKLLPSDGQLVHHGSKLHRCASDQRLLEIPASCHRISDDNPAQINMLTFFND